LIGITEALLDRHGVLTRGTVAFEGVSGGFSAVYPLLSRLEETGRIRRGYFVEGLGGAQFALPGAVDRLRGDSRSTPVLLAATDPANAYGAALPWPDDSPGRLARDAGAYVLIDDGALLAYLDRSRKGLMLLDSEPERMTVVAAALARVAPRHRRFTLATVNGEPIGDSQLAPALSEWGFALAPHGLSYRG
jgi:ATP-dependent Lhr-like helicase